MRVYSVDNGKDYCETFYNLREAKKAMKKHHAKGYITHIGRNGEWENLGEIRLEGRNSVLVAGTRQTTSNYG